MTISNRIGFVEIGSPLTFYTIRNCKIFQAIMDEFPSYLYYFCWKGYFNIKKQDIGLSIKELSTIKLLYQVAKNLSRLKVGSISISLMKYPKKDPSTHTHPVDHSEFKLTGFGIKIWKEAFEDGLWDHFLDIPDFYRMNSAQFEGYALQKFIFFPKHFPQEQENKRLELNINGKMLKLPLNGSMIVSGERDSQDSLFFKHVQVGEKLLLSIHITCGECKGSTKFTLNEQQMCLHFKKNESYIRICPHGDRSARRFTITPDFTEFTSKRLVQNHGPEYKDDWFSFYNSDFHLSTTNQEIMDEVSESETTEIEVSFPSEKEIIHHIKKLGEPLHHEVTFSEIIDSCITSFKNQNPQCTHDEILFARIRVKIGVKYTLEMMNNSGKVIMIDRDTDDPKVKLRYAPSQKNMKKQKRKKRSRKIGVSIPEKDIDDEVEVLKEPEKQEVNRLEKEAHNEAIGLKKIEKQNLLPKPSQVIRKCPYFVQARDDKLTEDLFIRQLAKLGGRTKKVPIINVIKSMCLEAYKKELKDCSSFVISIIGDKVSKIIGKLWDENKVLLWKNGSFITLHYNGVLDQRNSWSQEDREVKEDKMHPLKKISMYWKEVAWLASSFLITALLCLLLEDDYGTPLLLNPISGFFIVAFAFFVVNIIGICLLGFMGWLHLSIDLIKNLSKLKQIFPFRFTVSDEVRGDILLENFLVDVRLECLRKAHGRNKKKISRKIYWNVLTIKILNLAGIPNGEDFNALMSSLISCLKDNVRNDVNIINTRLEKMRYRGF